MIALGITIEGRLTSPLEVHYQKNSTRGLLKHLCYGHIYRRPILIAANA